MTQYLNLHIKYIVGLVIAATVFNADFVFCATDSSAPTLAASEELYKKKDYPAARSALEKLVKKEPDNGDALYLLGNVYLQLKMFNDARAAYKQSLSIDDDGQVASYCRNALASLDGRSESSVPSSAASNNTVAPQAESSIVRQIKQMNRSVGQVSDQANFAGSNASQECSAKLKQICEETASRQDKLYKEFREKFDAVEKGNEYYFRGTVRFDKSANATLAQLQKDYDNDLAKVQADSERQLRSVKQYYNERNVAVEEAATNLEKGYSDKRVGNAQLAPMGTNFYTRNYQTHGTPSGIPIPVSAPPAKSLQNP